MDLTSGFYIQAPLHEDSQPYTTFWTPKGMFQWTRVPMGPLDSPKYFQEMMTTHVLHGLLGDICCLYIDDLIVWAESEEQLLQRLEKVFDALADKGLVLNPKKCKFGLSKIEYLGHTIDNDGRDFSDDKIMKLMDFPIPKSVRQIKAFLVLANYFTGHILMFADILVPLRHILKEHPKGKPHWSVEEQAMFAAIKKSIANICKLYYLDPEHGEICVFTDASVRRCPTCQMLNPQPPKNNPAPYTEAVALPHERINIDTVDCTPRDEDGYDSCLVIVDCFTR
jgi:hypothetical protein